MEQVGLSPRELSSIRPSQGARWREARGRLGEAGCGSNGSGSSGDPKVRKQGTGGSQRGTEVRLGSLGLDRR